MSSTPVRPGSRCESWAVVHDTDPDTAEPYQQPSALTVNPEGDLLVAAGYGAEDLGDTNGQARTRWRLLGLDPATGEQRWLTRPGPDDAYARPLDVAVSRDGSTVLATGYAASAFGQADADLLVVALDAATGAPRWEAVVPASIARPDATDARGWFVLDDGAGTVVVAGTWRTPQPGGSQGLLALTLDAADGRLLGHHTVSGVVPTGVATPKGLALSPDGRTAYVGATSSGRGQYDIDMLAVALDLTDTTRPQQTWQLRHDGRGAAAPDRANAMSLSPDGDRLHLTGISSNDLDGPPFDVDYAVTTLALDASDGRLLWEAREDLGGIHAEPTAIAPDGDGGVVVVGSRTDETGRQGFALAHDAGGALRWQREVTTVGHDNESLSSVVVSGGRAIATGTSSHTATGTALPGTGRIAQVLTTALDTVDGTIAWHAHWNATTIGDDAGRQVVADGDGHAYVLAQVTNNVELDRNFYDVGVVAYRAD